MKRTLVITLAFVMVLGVVGCGTKKTDTKPAETPVVKEEVMPAEETNEPTEEVKTNEEEVMPAEETIEPTEEVIEPVEEEVETNEEATNPNPIIEKDDVNGKQETKPSNAGSATHPTEAPPADDGAKAPVVNEPTDTNPSTNGGAEIITDPSSFFGGMTSEDFCNEERNQGYILPGDPGYDDTPIGH